MTDKQDPIAHAARLLREAAEELRQAHAYNNSEGWENETDAKAAYDDHLAAAQALEDWEAAVGAGGVQALSAAPATPTAEQQASPKAAPAQQAGEAAESVPAVEREQERIAFKDAHRHLELYEVPDAWGRPMFKHSHVEASWLGWIARASRGQASSQAGEYPALVCDYCGALTPDPWHSSGMLHGKMSKHIHSCDACAARGAAQAQDTLEPLTPEQIQDLLLCGDPTDEEMRLIRIGWDAARGIKGGQHGTE